MKGQWNELKFCSGSVVLLELAVSKHPRKYTNCCGLWFWSKAAEGKHTTAQTHTKNAESLFVGI
jgi:hypothetical protein